MTRVVSYRRTADRILSVGVLAVGAFVVAVAMSDRLSAQTPASDGTAASRLRLIAEEPQPTMTTRNAAPYPVAPSTPVVGDPNNPPPVPPPVAAGVAPRRNIDPTVPDAAIRQFMDEPRNEGAAPVQAFPEIRLRARIITAGKPPTALIEIGGPQTRSQPAMSVNPQNPGGQRRQAYQPQSSQPSGVFRTIREGDEFVIPQGDTTSPIRVAKLTADEVIIEVVNRKAMIRLD